MPKRGLTGGFGENGAGNQWDKLPGVGGGHAGGRGVKHGTKEKKPGKKK